MSAQGLCSPKPSSNELQIDEGKDLATAAATRARVSVDIADALILRERMYAELDRIIAESNRTPPRPAAKRIFAELNRVKFRYIPPARTSKSR